MLKALWPGAGQAIKKLASAHPRLYHALLRLERNSDGRVSDHMLAKVPQLFLEPLLVLESHTGYTISAHALPTRCAGSYCLRR